MKQIGRPDYVLLGMAGLLIIFGLVMLTSASSVVAFEKWGNSFYLVKHQLLLGFLPGLFLFFLALKTPYSFWQKISLFVLGAGILMLILLLIPGVTSALGGSRSWLIWGGFSFQPSEFLKIGLIFYLAAWLSRHNSSIRNFSYGFLPFLLLIGLISLLIVLQPDIGTLMIIVVVALVMYFLAGGPWRHFLILALLGLIAIFLLVKIAPYRTARLTTFLHPELDPQGIGYHVNQALLGIGSGGLFGLGFGQSRQKFRYLPEASGDSIFAVIAEEFGFFISLILIAALLFVFYRIFRIARDAPDDFAKFTALGIGSWFILQFFINISSMIGLLPLTGLPLPFISYGGTALFTSMFALGVLGNISKYCNK